MHWLARHRLVLLGLIAAFWTALVALAHFFPSAPFLSGVWNGERSFSDLLRRDGRKTAVDPEFVFVGIDQQSLQPDAVGAEEAVGNRALELILQKPYPWSREVWSLLMDQLFNSGARLVMFDIVFSSTNEGDAAFRAALDKYRDRVVIGSNINVLRPDLNSKQTTDSENNQTTLPNQTLIPAPQGMDDRVGFVNFWRDVDGIVRHVEFHHSDLPASQRGPNEFIYDSLAARALKKLSYGDPAPNNVDSHAIRFGPEGAYPPHPLYEVFLPKTWHANYQDGAFFKNKIVIVGAAAQIQHDFVATPIDENMYGPAMHLHTLAAALDHEFVHEVPIKDDFVFIIIAALLAWCVVAFVRRPLFCILVLVGIAVGYLIATRVL